MYSGSAECAAYPNHRHKPFPFPESLITSSSRLEVLMPVISLLRNLMALHMLADRGRHWVKKLQKQYLMFVQLVRALRENSKMKIEKGIRKMQRDLHDGCAHLM